MMEKHEGATAAASPGEYKDFAVEAAILEAQQNRQSQGVPGTHEPFPVQLHWVLEQTEKDALSHVVRWAPHGRAFVVHHRDLFVQQVLPVYFNQTKFTSFQRQLSLYGFRRLSKGPDRGGYYHPMFLRISRTFTRNITRTKVKNEGPRKAAKPDTEPDFYKMPNLVESISKADTGRAVADTAASALLATPSNLRDPNQYVVPARLNNYPLDASESRLPYQPGSPVLPSLRSPVLSSLPTLELDHSRLLANQLQFQNQANALRRTSTASFPSLPAQLPVRTSSLANNPTWMEDALRSVSQNVPSIPDLLFQANVPTYAPAPAEAAAAAAISAAAAVSALGSQQTNNEVRVPSPPSLSDAIAQILGARSSPSLPPSNPNFIRDGIGRGL